MGKLKLSESAPVAWQSIHGTRRPIKAEWKLLAENRLGISVGDYDHSLPLTIDPVLAYSTHLGGNTENDLSLGTSEPAFTFINSIVLDGARNVYVAGSTSAVDFPTTAGAFDRTPNTQESFHSDEFSQSGFVSKFDKTGRILIYSTFLHAGISNMTVDSSGHAYTAEFGNDASPGPNLAVSIQASSWTSSALTARICFIRLLMGKPRATRPPARSLLIPSGLPPTT